MSVHASQGARRPLLEAAVVRELLRADRELRLSVVSGSMSPLLRGGDWVTVRPVSGAGWRLGDIALLEKDGKLTSHRVIRIDHDKIQTKGDSALSADSPIALGQVLGVVALVQRGQSNLDLRRPHWLAASIAVARIGRLEAGLWEILHPGNAPGSLRKPLDMINWMLRMPLRGITWAVVTLALWNE